MMLALILAVVLDIQDGKVHRSGDSLQEIPVGSFRVRGHVADVMKGFFENRIFSDYAKTRVWKEARDAFALFCNLFYADLMGGFFKSPAPVAVRVQSAVRHVEGRVLGKADAFRMSCRGICA